MLFPLFLLTSSKTLVQSSLTPAFIPFSTYFRSVDELRSGRSLNVGVSEQSLDRLVDLTAVATYRSDLDASSVPKLAAGLRGIADSTLRNQGIERPSRLLRQWLCAEAICAWAVSHLDGDPDLAAEKDFKLWWDGIRPGVTLAKRPLRTICSGNAFLTRDLARALTRDTGLEARYVGGWLRSDDGSVPADSNHAWTCFVFEGGLEVPADTVSPLVSRDKRLQWTSKRGAWPILPRSRESWEMFLAFHYGVETYTGDDWVRMPKNPQDPFTRLSFQEWSRRRDVSTALSLRRTRHRVD